MYSHACNSCTQSHFVMHIHVYIYPVVDWCILFLMAYLLLWWTIKSDLMLQWVYILRNYFTCFAFFIGIMKHHIFLKPFGIYDYRILSKLQKKKIVCKCFTWCAWKESITVSFNMWIHKMTEKIMWLETALLLFLKKTFIVNFQEHFCAHIFMMQ